MPIPQQTSDLLKLQEPSNRGEIVKFMSSMDQAEPDAFDGSAEPLVYMSENRIPVMVEFNSVLIYIIFTTLLVSLFLILPGVRRTKFASFLSIFTLLLMGAAIILGLVGSQWLTGSVDIRDSPYSSLSVETVSGKLKLDVGLSSTNVTLTGKLVSYTKLEDSEMMQENIKPVHYNERFFWDQPDRMANDHHDALRRGLPFPILTVSEFLSQDLEGFNWTRQIRQAGQFCSLALYLSFASWTLTGLLMCMIPNYLPYMMQITGALMMFSVSIFTVFSRPSKNLDLMVGDTKIELAYGYTYVTTFVTGASGLLVGLLLLVLQMNESKTELTVMDSEFYLGNRKAMYQRNLANLGPPLNYFKKEIHRGSVVIPIDDIHEKFSKATKK